MLVTIQEGLGPANDGENELTLASVVKEDLACLGSSSLKKKKKSFKRQASSSKQRLTMVQGSCRMYIERYIMDNEQLKRIADAIEEILRLVKEDQERSRKYMEKQKDE